MFCFKCGAKLPEGSAFCMKCGAKLPVTDEEPVEQPAPVKALPPAKAPAPSKPVEKAPAYPPEDAAVIPRDLVEDYDCDEIREWLEEHDENGVFALEYGTKYINERAFYANDIIEEIYIPDSVLKILDQAFACCVSLKKIKLSESMVDIRDFAFSECCSLTSIIIPNSVKRISQGAFSGCTSLKTVYMSSMCKIFDFGENEKDQFFNCGAEIIRRS